MTTDGPSLPPRDELRETVARAEFAARISLHDYNGLCPDTIEGWGSRDPECAACQMTDDLQRLAARRDDLAEKVAAVISGVRAWCAINEIAEPPLDWAGLGEFLDRAALTSDRAATEGES